VTFSRPFWKPLKDNQQGQVGCSGGDGAEDSVHQSHRFVTLEGMTIKSLKLMTEALPATLPPPPTAPPPAALDADKPVAV
jgi:hypothetical protein